MNNWQDSIMSKAVYILKERGQNDALELLKHCVGIEITDDIQGLGGEPLIVTLVGDTFLVDALNHDEKDYWGEKQVWVISNPAGKQLEVALEEAHNLDDDNSGTVRLYGKLTIPNDTPDWHEIRDTQDNQRLTLSEIYTVVNGYIGV